MHNIASAILLVLLALGSCGAEEIAANLVPRVIIFVPVGTENEEPVVVFSVKNTGKTELSVKSLLSPGSVLEWVGPRGITWNTTTGIPTTNDIAVPPGADVEVATMQLHDLYLEMGMGAKVHDKKLIDGDEFRIFWKVAGTSSNHLLFKFSRAK